MVTIIAAVASVGPAIMILAGSYMLALGRVPPPRRLWGAPDGSGAPLVRPRLLGFWLACWGAVFILLLVLSLITGRVVVIFLGFMAFCVFFRLIVAPPARFPKLNVLRRAYRAGPDVDSSKSSTPDESA